jgi:hypothetical protein
MAEEFKDGLEHLPLTERIAMRANSVADLAAQVTGGIAPRAQLQAVSEEYQSFREEIAAVLGVSADPDECDLVEAVRSERSSRQAWAEEALKMETIAERMLTFFSQHDERLAFMSRRYQSDGSGVNFRRTRCTGISADALAWFAVGRRDEPKRSEYPADPADFAACQRTYDMAPAFLQERMKPVLERYLAAVAERYPDEMAGFARPVCAVHPENGGGS